MPLHETMPLQQRQKFTRVMIDLQSVGVVDRRQIVDNLVDRVITIAQLPNPRSRLAHWDRRATPPIKKQKTLIRKAVCFNVASLNHNTYPCEWSCGSFRNRCSEPIWRCSYSVVSVPPPLAASAGRSKAAITANAIGAT